jgi:hypothetical protein
MGRSQTFVIGFIILKNKDLKVRLRRTSHSSGPEKDSAFLNNVAWRYFGVLKQVFTIRFPTT